VTNHFKLVALGGAASVIIIAGGFYIVSLRADLDEARQASLVAQQQVQKLSANLGQTEASLASNAQAQDQLKAQLTESNMKLQDVSAELSNEIATLKQQVSALQTEINAASKISGWWRDLFDYTKPFKGIESQETSG